MIIFLYGEDTFRSRKKLKELKEKFLREVDKSGHGLAVLDGSSAATMERISEAADPSSLFSKKRMLVIENFFSNKGQDIFSQALDYFKSRPGAKDDKDDNIVVFWDGISKKEKMPKAKGEFFQFLAKQKFAGEFGPLSSAEIMAWAKNELAGRGVEASREAISLLAGLSGNDLWLMSSEIEKLASYKTSGRIEVQDVAGMVKGQFDENIFALTDAISNKNKARAVELFSDQLEGGLTDFYLLNMITRQFRVLLQVRQALESGLAPKKINDLLKLHPYVVQKAINQTRNFSLETLKKIFAGLVEIDFSLKRGEADAKTLLSLMIAGL